MYVPSEIFSDIALNLLQHLEGEVSKQNWHLQQYFQVFLNYANRGAFKVYKLVSSASFWCCKKFRAMSLKISLGTYFTSVNIIHSRLDISNKVFNFLLGNGHRNTKAMSYCIYKDILKLHRTVSILDGAQGGDWWCHHTSNATTKHNYFSLLWQDKVAGSKS